MLKLDRSLALKRNIGYTFDEAGFAFVKQENKGCLMSQEKEYSHIRATLVAAGATLGSLLSSGDNASVLAELQSPRRADPARAMAEVDPVMQSIRLLNGDTHVGKFVRPEAGSAYLRISPNTSRGSTHKVPVSTLSQDALGHLWANDIDTGDFRVTNVGNIFVVANVRKFDKLQGLQLELIDGQERSIENPIGGSSPLHPRDQRRLQREASERKQPPVSQEVAGERRVIKFDELPTRRWRSAESANTKTIDARLVAAETVDGKVTRLLLMRDENQQSIAIERVSPSCRKYVDKQISRGDSSLPREQGSRLEPRTWETADGKHQVEATLVRTQDGTVVLRRTSDQKLTTVALDVLSNSDRQYIDEIEDSLQLEGSAPERTKTQAEKKLEDVLQLTLTVTEERGGLRDFAVAREHERIVYCAILTNDGAMHTLMLDTESNTVNNLFTVPEPTDWPSEGIPDRVSVQEVGYLVAVDKTVHFFTQETAPNPASTEQFQNPVTGLASNNREGLFYVNLGTEIRVFTGDGSPMGTIGGDMLQKAELLAVNEHDGCIAIFDLNEVIVLNRDGELKWRTACDECDATPQAMVWLGDELFVVDDDFRRVTAITEP